MPTNGNVCAIVHIEYAHRESIVSKQWTLENRLVEIREAKTKRLK
jgi:hypothetical protein